MRDNLVAALRLMLVTDDRLLAGRDPVAVCEAAVAGGVTMVQLRLKRAADREIVAIGRRLLAALAIPLIVNDRVDLALAIGAAGVHLGPDDLAPALARRMVPPGFIIGASVGLETEIARAAAADYWGIGPLRSTATKANAGAAIGLAGAGKIREAAGNRPVVLIGNVQPDDVVSARKAGFAGVAIGSGILAQSDVTEASRRYAVELDRRL
jgi:thiamine-phosphate pyrophosphorylase